MNFAPLSGYIKFELKVEIEELREEEINSYRKQGKKHNFQEGHEKNLNN